MQTQANTVVAAAFQQSIRSTALPFDGIYLPAKPPIDKIAAYTAIALHCEEGVVWFAFHNTNDFSAAQIEQWEKEKNVVCVDLGDRKYHNQHVGSATEWAVNRFRLPLTPGLAKLVELINRNNATGFLKGSPFAVAQLVREFYELAPEDQAYHTRVIRAAHEVLLTFVRAQNEKFSRGESDQMEPEVKKLYDRFAKGADKPLTLGQYVRHLWLLGHSAGYIQDKLSFWVENCRLYRAAQARAQHAFQTLRREEFVVAGGHKGILLRSSDHFLYKEVVRSRRYAIRVVVGADGHAAVSTDKLDCSKFHKFLELREPGRWHHNPQMGALINGGPQYTGVQPTEIPSRKLVELCKEFLSKK